MWTHTLINSKVPKWITNRPIPIMENAWKNHLNLCKSFYLSHNRTLLICVHVESLSIHSANCWSWRNKGQVCDYLPNESVTAFAIQTIICQRIQFGMYILWVCVCMHSGMSSMLRLNFIAACLAVWILMYFLWFSSLELSSQ